MRVSALLLCLALTGCSAKHISAPGVNLLIGPECHATAELLNCTNLEANPPDCKKARVRYTKGCEQVEVKP